jgi:GT2 family glycosyltransferase
VVDPRTSVAVSVVVPVRDDAARLAACLDALHAQVGAPPFEVVVVDNGSTDASAATAAAHPLRPVVVHEGRRGSYAARNAGVAAARGALLGFTDADCLPAPDWVAEGTRALADAPVVGGDVVPVRSAQPSVWERYDRAVYLRQQDLVEQQGFAATANLWVRREVLEQVGGFDPALLSSGDLELGRRAAAAGHRTAYCRQARVGHAPRTSAGQTWRLHRRLGAGWAVLGVRGGRWLPLGMVVDAVAADGPPLRRRRLAPVHLLAMTARTTGWLAQSTRRRARSEP